MIEICRYIASPVEPLTLERAEGNSRKIRGVASVHYNGQEGTEYELGDNLYERIAPGAFDSLLNADCIACVNHDPKTVVGRTPQTLKLWTTARGLEYEIDLGKTTTANDLWENVQRGLIRGSSFKARVNLSDNSQVEWKAEGEKDILVIKRFAELKDVSPVTEPAYKATDVQAVQRSLDQWKAYNRTQLIHGYVKNLRF